MPDLTTRTLVWLTYRLGAAVALGLPLVLLIWSGMKREPALVRLLGIYWKVASLLAGWSQSPAQTAAYTRLKTQLDGVCGKLDASDAKAKSACDGLLKTKKA